MTLGWVLTTPRLVVRPVEIDDAAAVFAARSAMPFDPPRRDLAATRAMIAGMVGVEPGTPGWAMFVVVDPAGGVIGDIGVEFDAPGPEQATIGFAFAGEARGRGFAGESVGALVAHLLGPGGRHRLTATTDRRNLAAQRLLTRVGFRQEAHYVRSWRDGDAWFDELGYARLAGE